MNAAEHSQDTFAYEVAGIVLRPTHLPGLTANAYATRLSTAVLRETRGLI